MYCTVLADMLQGYFTLKVLALPLKSSPFEGKSPEEVANTCTALHYNSLRTDMHYTVLHVLLTLCRAMLLRRFWHCPSKAGPLSGKQKLQGEMN